jgi:hypothetical protein
MKQTIPILGDIFDQKSLKKGISFGVFHPAAIPIKPLRLTIEQLIGDTVLQPDRLFL